MAKGACNENAKAPKWSYKNFIKEAKASKEGYTVEKHAAYVMKGIEDELVNKFSLKHGLNSVFSYECICNTCSTTASSSDNYR